MIDEKGAQVGVLPTEEARRIATERGYDLVEVGAGAKPPVCKLINYGKFKYQLRKKERKAKRKQHVVRLKQIRLRPAIGEHDLLIKINHARKFLEKGDKVLFTIFFRGRENIHREVGFSLMDRISKELEDIAKVESKASFEGTRLSMVLMHK